MAKKNTKPIRADKEFETIIQQVKAQNLMKGRTLTTPRVTLAISRQYKKHPELMKELLDADLQ